MKHICVMIFLFIIGYVVRGQESYTVRSKDGKVSVEHFIGFNEGLDSIILKNKNHKLRLSHHEPLFEIDRIVNSISINHNIKKIRRKIYLLYGIGTLAGGETQVSLIFIKKNKILKYYVLRSKNRILRSVPPPVEYFSKNKEIIISVLKKYALQDNIYEININNNTYSSIEPIQNDIQGDKKYHTYRLKVQ